MIGRALIALTLLCGVAHAQSINNPPTPDSAAIPLPKLTLSTYNVSEPAQAGQQASIIGWGAKCDGVTDDNAAINAAIASLSSGGTVVFPPGKTCRSVGLITVSSASVIIWGYGSTLFVDYNSSSTPSMAIKLVGASDAVYGLTILSNLNTRVSNTDSTAIWLTGDLQTVIDNRIEYTGTCTYAQGATHYFEARNLCFRSWADGLTSAGGGTNPAPTNGILVGNLVLQTGDEGISIVNYGGPGSPTLHDIYEAYNTVCDLYWSNGMSAHGGQHITMEHNVICKIPYNSAFDIDSTNSFTERDVNDVLVQFNVVSDIQTLTASYNPICCIHSAVPHGALYVNSASGHNATNIKFTKNTIVRAAQNAAQAQASGTTSGIEFSQLRWSGIVLTPVNVGSGMASGAFCSDLQTIDDSHNVPSNCTGSAPTVTGSSYTTR